MFVSVGSHMMMMMMIMIRQLVHSYALWEMLLAVVRGVRTRAPPVASKEAASGCLAAGCRRNSSGVVADDDGVPLVNILMSIVYGGGG